MTEGRLVAERFELRGFIGAGGFGDVWQATDARTGALVAVKFLRRPERVERERFAREAEILKALEHPSIVPLIAAGEGADGVPFIVMPWLEGETLQSRLSRGTLTVEETHAVALRTAEALAYAHGRGVLHRDLKPANLFLVGGRADAVRVLDFGLARTAPSPKLTATGLAVGTPGYMAPETARGDRTFDGRVDSYSLGCVLFRCLVGRDVFHGVPPIMMLLRAAHETPPRVRQIRPEVPAYLDDLVDALLSRDRNLRPTAAEAAQMLARRAATTRVPTEPRAVLPIEVNGFAILRPLPSVTLEELEASAYRDKERKIDAVVSAEGARLDVWPDGSMLLFPDGRLAPLDQLRSLARCCLALRPLLEGLGFAIVGDPAEGRAHTSSLLDAGARLLAGLDHPIIIVDAACIAALQPAFELQPSAHGAILLGAARGSVYPTYPPPEPSPPSRTQPDLDIAHLQATLAERPAPPSSWSWLSFAAGFLSAIVFLILTLAAYIAVGERIPSLSPTSAETAPEP